MILTGFNFFATQKTQATLVFSARERKRRKQKTKVPPESIINYSVVQPIYRHRHKERDRSLARLAKRVPRGLANYLNSCAKHPVIFMADTHERLKALQNSLTGIPITTATRYNAGAIMMPLKLTGGSQDKRDQVLEAKLRFLMALTTPIAAHFWFDRKPSSSQSDCLGNTMHPPDTVSDKNKAAIVLKVTSGESIDKGINKITQGNLYIVFNIAKPLLSGSKKPGLNLSRPDNLLHAMVFFPALGIQPFSENEQTVLCNKYQQFNNTGQIEQAVANESLRTRLRAVATIFSDTTNILTDYKRDLHRLFK